MKRFLIAVPLTIIFSILCSESLAIAPPRTLLCSIYTISDVPQIQSARQYKNGDVFELSTDESGNMVLMTNEEGALESLRGVHYSGGKIQFFLSNEVANRFDGWKDDVEKLMRKYPGVSSRLTETLDRWLVTLKYYTIILDRSSLHFKNPQDTINGKCAIKKETKKLI